MTTCDPTETPSGESVKTVTVLAPGAQWGAARGVVREPAMMSVTVTMFGMSGARPTAPFHENGGTTVPVVTPTPGALPAVAPSVVAGSPRVSGPGYVGVKTLGTGGLGSPVWTSASAGGGRE